MKIKLFLSSSLLLLGVWLAAAYNHTVDLSTYSQSADAPMQAQADEFIDREETESLPDLAVTR